MQNFNIKDSFPRLALCVAYILLASNFMVVFSVPGANMIDKGAFLFAAITFLCTRKVIFSIIFVLLITISMIIWLGSATSYPSFSWDTLFLSLTQIIIVYLFLAWRPQIADCELFMMLAALAPVISAILGEVYYIVGIHPAWSSEWGTGTVRFGGTAIPAFLSGLAMCGIFASLLLASQCGRKQYYFVLVLDLVVLFLAGGRAALAVAAALCALTWVFSPAIPAKTKLYAGIAFTFVLFFVALIFGQTSIERLSNSGDNGRELMWDYLLGLAEQYPNTGIGWGHQFLSVPHDIEIRTGSTSAHNDYIRLQTELGFIGMPAFYIMLALAILVVSKIYSKGFDFVILFSFIGFLILSRTDNALAAPTHFPLFLIAIMAAARSSLVKANLQGNKNIKVRRTSWAFRKPR